MATPPSPSQNKPTSPKKVPRPLESYLKYAHLSWQLLAVMGVGVGAGWWLDSYCQLRFPWFLCTLSLTGVTLSLVTIIKRLT